MMMNPATETNLEFFGPSERQAAVNGDQLSACQFLCAPGRLRLGESERHTLLFNIGGPLSITYWTDFQWKSMLVEQNSLICFLPAGRSAEIRWTQEMNLRVFMIDPVHAVALLDSVTGMQSSWNLADTSLTEFCHRMFAAMCCPLVPEKTYAASLTSLCFHSLLWQQRSVPMDMPARGRLSPRQLSLVISFAHDSMHLDIGLVDLANLVHLSAYHFGRLFKQTIGLSPYQFILQMKIEYAKKLIMENAGPLGEIAYQLNFSDQAHFSNAFRKATGISPRQYQHSRAAVI
jgi:AraC-like DNA-binding protein